MLASAYRKLTQSDLVVSGPALITGFMVETDTNGETITIYDGMDTLSGSPVLVENCAANNPNAVSFHTPIFINNGIYVTLSSAVLSASIFYIPLRGGSPLQAMPVYMVRELE